MPTDPKKTNPSSPPEKAGAKAAAGKKTPAKKPSKEAEQKAAGSKEANQKGAPAKQEKPAEGGRRRAIGVREELEEQKEMGGFALWMRDFFRESPAFAVSAVVHAIIVILLFTITLAPEIQKQVEDLVSLPSETEEEIEEEPEVTIDDLEVEEIEVTDVVTEIVEVQEDVIEPVVEMPDEPAEAPEAIETPFETPEMSAMSQSAGTSSSGSGISARGSPAAKARALKAGGGNEASENAVAEGLKWIAAHQMQDGGWDFDFGKCRAHRGPVRNPGSEQSRAGATAMALLPFLGAGQTHKEGEYKEVVRRGLYFLAGQGIPRKGNMLDLRGRAPGAKDKTNGSLYSHGIASIVLCEAYALTQDQNLAPHAQMSLNFITYAQDKTGGGWRYSPGQPGDTSVVGWQLMALKSGHLAYLQVDKRTIAGAINFLNIVQMDSGAYYGYTAPQKKPSTTAVGLLCRMYLGWKKDEPALEQGVQFLSNRGPSKSDMYYNYYATQVLHHFGGDLWKKWNSVMRDQLVDTQIKKGTHFEERGSWTPQQKGHAGERGGRLYETSMSVMTLEVYYRHLPLYKEQTAEDDF